MGFDQRAHDPMEAFAFGDGAGDDRGFEHVAAVVGDHSLLMRAIERTAHIRGRKPVLDDMEAEGGDDAAMDSHGCSVARRSVLRTEARAPR